jgi:hypothetical protein
MLNAIKRVDWGGLLITIANALTGIGGSVLGFLKGVDWGQLFNTIKNALATIGVAVFNFINSVDWLGLLATIVFALTGIGAAVLNFIVSQDWGGLLTTIVNALADIGNQILQFFLHVDWGQVGSALLNAITGALSGIGGGVVDTVKHALGLAEGGIVTHRPGGVLAVIGEGGEDEYVIPASKMGNFGAIAAMNRMAAGGLVSGGMVSSLSSTKPAASSDTQFNVTFQNATITSPQDAERLALQMGYKALEIMRRQGHMRG